jgi:hypothetical protein
MGSRHIPCAVIFKIAVFEFKACHLLSAQSLESVHYALAGKYDLKAMALAKAM